MENSTGESINLQLIAPQESYKATAQTERSPEASPRSANDDGSYDPHKHRNRPAPTSNAETLIHLLKGSLGTGILAMPNAFYNSGLVTGVIATIIIGFLCTYCLHVLVKAQYELCKQYRVPVLSYPQSMKYALEKGPSSVRWFAPYAPGIVDGFLIAYQLGICCVYIVFIATNIQQVANYYGPDFSIQIYMLILLVPLILINYIRNLKILAPFSTVANIVTFIGLAMVLVYVFDDLPCLSEREMFGSARNFSLYFGTTLFALEAVGVIIALENNMKTPQNFGGTCGVLNIGMSVIVVLYVVVGFFGYVKYGEKASGSITLDLPEGEIMAQSIKIMFAFAIFITYGLQGYVPVEIIWNTYLDHRIQKHKIFWEYVCRTLVTLVTFVLAISIPRLGLFISLFGALCLSALGIAFPAIIEICVMWPDKLGPCRIYLMKNILLILFGIVGLVVGTYVSLIEIINSFAVPVINSSANVTLSPFTVTPLPT